MKTIYKASYSLIFIFLFSICINGKANVNDLIPFSQEGLWGYMNKEKEIVIPPYYDEANFFNVYQNGFFCARVKKNNKYGLIDKNNGLVLPIKYDSISIFGVFTVEGFYQPIVYRGREKYLSPNGRIVRKINSQRSWICDQPDTWRCKELELIQDFRGSEKDNSNYEYRERMIVEVNGKLTDVLDTIEVQLDSIISIKSSDIKILYRDDGKINICRAYMNNGKVRFNLCMGYKYDEIEYVNCFKWERQNIYDPIVRVKSGTYWGLIDLLVLEQERIWGDYKNSWEFIPTKYLQVFEKEYDYYLVEYEKSKFGYIKPTGHGRVIEYWLNE